MEPIGTPTECSLPSVGEESGPFAPQAVTKVMSVRARKCFMGLHSIGDGVFLGDRATTGPSLLLIAKFPAITLPWPASQDWLADPAQAPAATPFFGVTPDLL